MSAAMQRLARVNQTAVYMTQAPAGAQISELPLLNASSWTAFCVGDLSVLPVGGDCPHGCAAIASLFDTASTGLGG